MSDRIYDSTETRLAEIERLIKDFKEKFRAGTSDAENFITMNEIEKLWGELQADTNNIYSDIVREMLNSVDESELIRKKKESIKPKG